MTVDIANNALLVLRGILFVIISMIFVAGSGLAYWEIKRNKRNGVTTALLWLGIASAVEVFSTGVIAVLMAFRLLDNHPYWIAPALVIGVVSQLALLVAFYRLVTKLYEAEANEQ